MRFAKTTSNLDNVSKDNLCLESFSNFRQGVPFKSFTSIFWERNVVNLFDEVGNAILIDRLSCISYHSREFCLLFEWRRLLLICQKLSHFKESKKKFTLFILLDRCSNFILILPSNIFFFAQIVQCTKSLVSIFL